MINQALPFLERTFKLLNDKGVKLDHWEIDHLCYRTSSTQNYQEALLYFKTLGQCLTESLIAGRPIATIKLSKPIRFKSYIIDLIEVPAPKDGQVIQEGFEHFEIVTDRNFSYIEKKYSHLSTSLVRKNNILNPELTLKLDQSSSVKFHYKSLEHVINLEQQDFVLSFLKKTDFIKSYASYSPCLSGTLPIKIATKESDLDVLLNAKDITKLLQKIEVDFSSQIGFCSKYSTQQGLASLTCAFEYDHQKIEIFAQDLDSYQQQANIHMLIEGRLLKLFGPPFKEKIVSLKKQGLKTEPAFGKILKLEKPYIDLIKLHFKSDQELIELYDHKL
jgi:predicted metalloenzyme YecM